VAGQTASGGIVGAVLHLDCLAEYLLPIHVFSVIGKRHGMRHKLKAVLKTSVVLAVQMLVVAVGYVHECIGVIATLTAIVDFKLYTDK
jgi:hypothetical protein